MVLAVVIVVKVVIVGLLVEDAGLICMARASGYPRETAEICAAVGRPRGRTWTDSCPWR
jgi:hypothetical protein